MKTRLGTAIVSILAILGGISGFLGAFGYVSFVGGSEGILATCHTLRVGEAKQLVTKAQRAEIAKLAVPTGKGDEQMAAYFMSDCSKWFLSSHSPSLRHELVDVAEHVRS
jgi:hypothetical protein